MGLINKFMDIMNLNENYDDDMDDFLGDDDDDEYEERYEEKRPSKSSFWKKNNQYNSAYDDVDDEYDEAPAKSAYNKFHSTNKVTTMRPAAQPRSNSGMGVCVIKPTSIDDGREICETLLDSRTVILNLEGLDLEIAQRIIDFTSGATFAMKGNLQKISNFIFIVTPSSVDISGDLQDLIGNTFSASTINTRY